jgi:D-alanine transaminase/branched-chain amino acid aminotransferase
MHTFINTDFLPAADASLGVNDLAIQRAYGVFDFFKTVGGLPIFLDDHLDRFFHSASQMRLAPGKTREELKAIIAQLMRLNNLPDSGIRIILTGGYSTDSINPGQPNLMIIQHPMSPPGKEPIAPVRLISYPHQRQLPDVKTIDYLMAIHLQPAIRERGAFDVLYHNNGVITECPRCNFFLVTAGDQLVTPARNMLKGVTRKQVLALAASTGLAVEERDVTLTEIPTAKEAFITSTSRHIIPVSHIDDIPIGSAAPSATPNATPNATAGPIAQQLNSQLYDLITKF